MPALDRRSLKICFLRSLSFRNAGNPLRPELISLLSAWLFWCRYSGPSNIFSFTGRRSSVSG